jgi:ketosteroid isomerase-like protein
MSLRASQAAKLIGRLPRIVGDERSKLMNDHASLFADIDSMDPDRFAQHLADDVVMRFGNADPVHGRAAVRDAWAGFCEGVSGVRHNVVEQWSVAPATIVEAQVTYTRKDGSQVTVPVVTVYRASSELIDDYRIFIDLAPLFAEAD